MLRTAFTLALLIAIGTRSPIRSAPVPVEKPTAKPDAEFERLWNNMGWYHPHAVKFWSRVHSHPKAGYAFMNRKIKPIQLSEAAAKRLIDDLGSEEEARWKAAEARLRVRDIRLAMNFLDAWEYTKSDLQRQRLASVTYFLYTYPQYYDVTLTQVPVPFCPTQQYTLQMTLSAGISKDIELQLGLNGGGSINLDAGSLSAPNNWVSPEETVIRYLAGTSTYPVTSLLERLGKGHPQIGATKVALAAIDKRSSRRIRRLGVPLSADELPSLWEQWGQNLDSDHLTQAMLLNPELALPFLRQQLRPIRPNALQVGLLLSLLAHPLEDVWQRTNDQLQRADPRFCMPLENLWQLANTVEQQRRLGGLLATDLPEAKYYDFHMRRERMHHQNIYMLGWRVRKDLPIEKLPVHLKGRDGGGGVRIYEQPDEISQSKWSREEAAIWVLEAIGTDEALSIVKRMAAGHPDAGPTIAAKEVLARRFPK